MLIRRNTKAFKTLQEIITSCQERTDRQSLVRLYITKAGHSIQDRIGVEGNQGEAIFFYDLNYQAVQNHLKSSTHQLHLSDDLPGIYYFRSNLGTEWDETPFEFDTEIKKLFSSLPDLPATKEKGKTKEFVLPPPTSGSTKRVLKKEKEKKKEAPPPQAFMTISRGKQPDYNLKQDISFSDLDKITIWKGQLSKRDVLDHYDKIAPYLLPYLENRSIKVRTPSDGKSDQPYTTPAELPGNPTLPSWIKSQTIQKEKVYLCNDKEHLLFYVELGITEFAPSLALVKSTDIPDNIVINVQSEAGFSKVTDAALVAKEILDGLKIASMIKTNGYGGLHIHIHTDAKSEYESCTLLAEYLCKLIKLKVPALVSLDRTEDNSFDKVILDYAINSNEAGVVAPYSFGAGSAVATPLLWKELTDDLHPEDFNYQTIFDRLKKVGDPFSELSKKKVNVQTHLEKMEEHYAFLF